MKREDVVDELKKYTPHSLKVTLADGTEKPVAVPRAGNRWSRCQQVLDAMRWVSIEALDKEGRVLHVIEDDDDDTLDQLDDANVPMARVMLEVMRATMRESRAGFQGVLDGMARLMASMSEGQQALVDSYRSALQVTQQNAVIAQSPSENAEMMQMLQMGLAMLRQQQLGKPGGG